MTTTSRVSLLIDALIASITAAVPSTVPVYDGPAVNPGDDLQMVLVGHDGGDGEAHSATISSSWAGLGQRARDEMADIDCCVVARSGDPSLKAVRDQATNLLGLVDAALRATPGQNVSGVFWTEITAGDMYQSLHANGAMVRFPFTVHARSRI